MLLDCLIEGESRVNSIYFQLASVAYQINTIATSFLQLLDLQSNQFNELETNLNGLSEDTNVHKEKVARREIGTLTTNKALGRQPLFIKPSNPEKLVRYVRKPLDYSMLDDIGQYSLLVSAASLHRWFSI